ncbi:MAG: sugar phosphate isomerase/epimerase [Candidatus Bathyarchaeia archaeon]
MPEIGVSTLHLLGEPFEKMAKKIIKMEIKHVEIVDEGLHSLNNRRVAKLKRFGKTYGLKFSVHAPFADINIASPSRKLLKAMLKRLECSIKFARDLEACVWVFHPGLKTGVSMFYPQADWTQNCRTAQLLYNMAEEYGVKIAVENVPEPFPFVTKSVKDFERFFKEVSEDIYLTLDMGHSNINGQTQLFLETFKDRIIHIHAHDNDGREDLHLGIGCGTVNWENFAKLLKAISYDKVIVVESVEKVVESVGMLKSMFE